MSERLTRFVAEAADITREEAKERIRSVFDVMLAAAEEGRIEISGLGVFDIVDRKPRQNRNPATGGMMTIPARRQLRFRDLRHRAKG